MIFCFFLIVFVSFIVLFVLFALKRCDDDSDDDLGYLENIDFLKGGFTDEEDS